MTQKPRTRITVFVGLTALIATGMLSACSFEPRAGRPSAAASSEHSHADAAAALAELPGITAAEISTSTEGTPNQVLLFARVSADAGFTADSAELLDYVLRQAWSSTDEKPVTTVRVELTLEGQEPDLVALAEELGLAGMTDPLNKYDSSVRIPVAEMAAVYGAWPGPVPEPPASLSGEDQ